MELTVTGEYETKRLEWLDRLDAATGINSVLQICQDICTGVDRKQPVGEEPPGTEIAPGSPIWGTRLYLNNELLVRLRRLMESTRTTFAQRRIIAKSLFKIYAHQFRQSRMVFPVGGVLPKGAIAEEETISIYGMIFSGFLTLPGLEDLTTIVKRNFELFQTSGCYTRHFNTVAENMLALCKIDLYDKFFKDHQEKIWHTILLNLESPYKGIREGMLALLKNLIYDDKFVRSLVLPAILRWSWLNRNKLHILLALLGRYQFKYLECLAGEQIQLYPTLELSLHYKHLFSGSQGIVRVLQKQGDDRVFELQVKILMYGEIGLVRTMIKQWFSNLTQADFRRLFQMLQLDQLKVGENRKLIPEYLKRDNFVKFFQYMNLFRREFQTCKDLNILLVLMLQISTEVELESSSIALLVETLVHHITTPSASIHPSTSVFYIFKLKEYILQNLSVPSSIIGATFVAQSAKLLSHIASLSLDRYEQNEDAYAIVSELMGTSVFHQHLQKQAAPESNYHAIITSLKMFQCFASLFLEFTDESPYRLQEKTVDGVPHLLPVEADTFYDMIYTVEHLLVSEFDDVKATALRLLYNKHFAYHYGPAMQGRLSLIYSYKNPSAVLEAMISFFDESHIALLSSLRDHERDLFAMMKNDGQLYNQIDAITEAFFGYTESRTLRILDDIKAFPKMLILVNRVVEFVLRSLNCAKTDEQRLMVGSTFEIMDNSLQLLLERSSQRSTNLAADKKTMMVAMWKALRSAGSFLENYAMWTLDNYRNRLDTIDHLSICLRAFIMMLLNCCHRGAIESAGVGFGRVIKKIAALKECLVVRNDHRSRQAKRIVELAERMFRALVRLDLQESDFRRCRGYLWLIHNFIKSDSNTNAERSYLKIYIEMHRMPVNGMLVPADALSRMSVLQLHQLNLMVREATMNETILEYIDDLMIIALERFKSPEWTMRNAALQLYSSIVTKLVGQRQQCSDPDCNWPIVYVSLNEIIFKLTKSTKYILKQLRSADRVPTPFLILVLEFLAKVEYRAYSVPGQKATVVDFRIQMWRFLSHENDQVRILAATCFTQLHEFHDEIPRMMENLIIILFTARGNENFRHGLLKAIHFCIRKYVTNARHVGATKEDFLAQMRHLMEKYSVLDTAMVSSYRLRYHLLDLLLYLGFAKMDRTVVSQVFHKLAPSNHGLNVFLMKTNALYNARAEETSHGGDPPAMEYEVIIECSDNFGGPGGDADPDED
ncbi:hypothetical protein quinque_015468 [Culex quinquefasciatus]|nr:uncharacterized protein LOC6042737 [Culex quinquefasciatus]